MATPIRVDSAGGEYMENVVVLEWAAKLGDAVTAGQTLVTVETAKAATEIEAACDGFLTAIMAEVGSEVPLSAVLGLIGATADDLAYASDAQAADAQDPAAPQPATTAAPPAAEPASRPAAARAATGRLIVSPAAKREAARLGLDLQAVQPSSPSGRIKLRDLANLRQPAPAIPATTLPADDFSPLRVLRTGSATGVPVLMIHGFGADAPSWSPIERELARHHPVLRLELPNHGQSPKRRIARFAALAKDITQAFDDQHLDAVHLVGHSLGGACALALADVRPGKIASLTLIAPGGLGPKINGDFIEGLARASTPDSLGAWLRQMVADPRLIGDDFARAAMATRTDPALRAAQAQMARDLFPDSTQAFDLRAALDRLTTPTRIIWGRADAVLPWQQALAAAGRIGLHLFDATGHVPQLEQTEAVLAILRDQLQRSMP